MTEKIIDYNKSEINMSPIKEWKDLEGTEFLELLTSGAELDAELYELAVKKVPQLVKQSKLVLKSSHKTMKQTMKSQLFPGPVSMAAHVRCWQSGRFNRSGWCPCQALASVSGNTESPRRRAAAGRPQDTRSHAAAAEFSGLVSAAVRQDRDPGSPCGNRTDPVKRK